MGLQTKHTCDWKGCGKPSARAITIYKQKTPKQPYHNYGSPYLCAHHRFLLITYLMDNIDYNFKRGEPSK